MKTTKNPARFWNTASFGGSAETSSFELLSLGDHLGVCKNQHDGRLFMLHCAIESVQEFVATRFVTSVVVGALLIGVLAFAL